VTRTGARVWHLDLGLDLGLDQGDHRGVVSLLGVKSLRPIGLKLLGVNNC
jgi:hypothetical protein